MHALDRNSNHDSLIRKVSSLVEELEVRDRHVVVFVNEPVTMTKRQKKIAKAEMIVSSSYNDVRSDDVNDDDSLRLYKGASGRTSDEILERASRKRGGIGIIIVVVFDHRNNR